MATSMSTLKEKLKSKLFIDYIFLSLCLFCLLGTFEVRSYVFFRDYSITFEGAYRLFNGQIPYRDFGSPVGPISFVIPALFFKIFKPNWSVFIISQQFENVCMLVLMFALLSKINIEVNIKRVALICFTLFYLLLQTHPWYNSTATLLLIAATLCALYTSSIYVISSGLISGLAVLAKQDFGLLTILISGLLVVILSLGSDLDKIIPSYDTAIIKKEYLRVARNLGLYTTSIVLIILTFILLTDSEGFKYWFNYGQPPHEIRNISIKAFLFGALGWLMLVISLYFNNFQLLVASLFIIAGSITRATSGLSFTHYYYVVFIPVVLKSSLEIRTILRQYIIAISFILAALMLIRPIIDVYHVYESIARKEPEHFFFDYRHISKPLTKFPSDFLAFSSFTQASQDTINAINELKNLTTQYRTNNIDLQIKVLNVSELTPIYAELEVTPPKGLPLWFHSKVSLFPNQLTDLNNKLASHEFDIILLQATHEGLTPTYTKFFSIINKNSSYELFKTIHNSPANTTWLCEPNCQGDILIYVKKTFISSK